MVVVTGTCKFLPHNGVSEFIPLCADSRSSVEIKADDHFIFNFGDNDDNVHLISFESNVLNPVSIKLDTDLSKIAIKSFVTHNRICAVGGLVKSGKRFYKIMKIEFIKGNYTQDEIDNGKCFNLLLKDASDTLFMMRGDLI